MTSGQGPDGPKTNDTPGRDSGGGLPPNLPEPVIEPRSRWLPSLVWVIPIVAALIEAVALNYADDTDAKMETFKEILENNSENSGWLGYNRLFESNLRATKME